MASTNFRVFNEANAPANTYNDSEYQNATQRQSGVIPGMAISRMHNKMYFQWSSMATAIAQYLVSRGYDCNDDDLSGIVSALENSCGLNIRQDSTAYAAGDIAYSAALSSVLFLECTTAGITASSIPAALTGAVEGDSITDGTVVWIVRKIASMADVRAASPGQRQASTVYAVNDMASLGSLPYGWYLLCTTPGTTSASALIISTPAVGDTVNDGTVVWTVKKISTGDGVPLGSILPFAGNGDLPSGYLLCDGQTVSRTMYPDLFNVIGTTYGAGDGSTTFNLPDYNSAERFVQGSTVAGTEKSAGLPNITGSIDFHTFSGAATGAFYSNGGEFRGGSGTSGGGGSTGSIKGFDASRSSPIYGNSNTVQPPALTARYIIKAFDEQTPDSALIDITQYANELARVQTSVDTIIDYIIESYRNGTEWYEVYKSGKVRQGGYIAAISPAGFQTINLLKNYKTVDYYARFDNVTDSNAMSSDGLTSTWNKTTSSFQVKGFFNKYWIAEGQGA